MSVSTQREGGTKGRGWTPGPWRWSNRYSDSQQRETWSLIGADGYGILSCDGTANSPQGLGDTANAPLIAAAPDLFEFAAAHDAYMLDAGYSGPDDSSLHPKAAANWRACRSALSRATATSEVEHG